MIICGTCGEVFRRVHWNNRDKKSIVWRCVSRLENTELFCDARTVQKNSIEKILIKAINETLGEKDTFLSILENNIATVISQDNNQALYDIDKRLEELQAELLKLASTKSDYEDVANEIYTPREEKQKVQVDSACKDEIKKQITDMSTFLKEQPTTITEYDESLVRRLIEKVTIHKDEFTVGFKSGLSVDIEE